MMIDTIKKMDELGRLQFTKTMAKGLLGLNIIPMLGQANAATQLRKGAKAKSVIYVKVTGGLSHVDSFDIKEKNKDAMKGSSPIKTSANGIRIGKHFPKLAEQMHHCAIINSMSNTQGAHKEARYLMSTGYEPRGTVVHPELGGWVNKLAPSNSGDIPSFIKVGKSNRLGGGFFGSKYSALPIFDPEKGVLDIKPDRRVDRSIYKKRIGLMNELNREFESKIKNENVLAYQQIYKDAIQLMNSKDLTVFDISRESDKVHKAYGEDRFGQSCLLARRLVEKGVRFVEVNHGDWDHHYDIYDEFGENAVGLDQGVAALLVDLKSRGLLDSTLVVVNTEFGRGAELNSRAGRNHHPAAYSSLLAGGGIKGGQKYGKTDSIGRGVVENKVSVADFNATIAYAMGLPLDHIEKTAERRPFKISDKGKPITSLF